MYDENKKRLMPRSNISQPHTDIITLLPHQLQALKDTEHFNKVAYYYDMGLGKTFIGSEKMKALNNEINVVVCQKSKVNDWVEHFQKFYPNWNVIDGTKRHIPQIKTGTKNVIVINYDLTFRRKWFSILNHHTLLLDESSYVKNSSAKRTKMVLNSHAKNVILLSGTPTGGKYEELWTQLRLLGCPISEKNFWNEFIITREIPLERFNIEIVAGYKNIPRLKELLAKYGAIFKKSDEVLNLPEQTFQVVYSKRSSKYAEFLKDDVVECDGRLIEAVNPLSKLTHLRTLASPYNPNKLESFKDLINSTNDRIIVFYNFTEELNRMKKAVGKSRPCSVVNGKVKDLKAYETDDDSITFVQYQAGAMGLNLQKANKIIYYSLPLSSELFEQSKKRIHRIGQKRPCFYWTLITKNTVEENIKQALERKEDYTEFLFIKEWDK